MTKTQKIYVFLALMFLTSCTSYYKLKPTYFVNQNLHQNQWLDLEEFDIYTFNICESYKKNVDPTNRFKKCPRNFFEISAKDSIRKVEELYLLIHKSSDLAIYMTTFSHKYIKKQKGFLNDPDLYKEKFYLRDTEYIYVGKFDAKNELILFDKQKKKTQEKEDSKSSGDQKIEWYYKGFSPSISQIEIEKAHIETVENANDTDKITALNKVFSVPFNFRLTKYELFGVKSKDDPRAIEKLQFRENSKGYFEVIFRVKEIDEGYRFPSRKVLYFTK